MVEDLNNVDSKTDPITCVIVLLRKTLNSYFSYFNLVYF